MNSSSAVRKEARGHVHVHTQLSGSQCLKPCAASGLRQPKCHHSMGSPSLKLELWGESSFSLKQKTEQNKNHHPSLWNCAVRYSLIAVVCISRIRSSVTRTVRVPLVGWSSPCLSPVAFLGLVTLKVSMREGSFWSCHARWRRLSLLL